MNVYLGIFILFILVTIIVFLIIIGYIIYGVAKKYISKKTANYSIIFYALMLFYISINIFYEDELFSKNDAIDLVEDLDFKLNDDFELTQNISYWGIGDYYHTFTLEISENDKNRLINEIKSSPNFMNDSIYSTTNKIYPDRYKGKKVVWNYEDKESYVRQHFQPNGDGYSPTNRNITIHINSNELRFEDIDD